MSSLVLARKYRPRRFGEMVGQEHVVQALVNALSSQRLHHAYLFTGTRGVGKTTLARVLAMARNCEHKREDREPCGECPYLHADLVGRGLAGRGDLARPLFHILNMMNTDLDLGRWNMAEHPGHNITSVLSNSRTVKMVARDTKGGQLSIFADGIEGAFWIEIMGELTGPERAFLKTRYPELDAAQMDALVRALTRIRAGEIQPHYITWYGFYEGKTRWRTDPVTIAFIFGLRTLEAIESAFTGRLFDVMMTRFADR